MTVQLTKDSIDLGIHVKDPEKSLAFYRDTLGFELVGEADMPGGMHMWRLMCGTSMIKLVNFVKGPKAETPGGGIIGANGYRYWTISVSNLDEIAAKCEAAGYKLAVPVTTIRPGTAIAMVEDPDGNWVEFLAAV
jgi:catechol 2,3-dioxygenase-like lactoylglutathione lyase family enzyme